MSCDDSQDLEIEEMVSAKRRELLAEAGLPEGVEHYRRPAEGRLTKGEIPRVTLLFGGFTKAHEELIRAAEINLGYNVERLPVPTKADFQAGREFGNHGMCSPSYFVTGTLVNYLRRLRDEQGLSAEEIIRDYVFVTVGSCGPCRFGMYESEYHLALKNSGFEGFRAMFFEQRTGLAQARDDDGLSFNEYFFLALLNGIVIGDVVNELSFQLRPYEVVPGQVDAVMDKVMTRLTKCMGEKRYDGWEGSALAKGLSLLLKDANASQFEKILDQLFGDHHTRVLGECAAILNEELEVDFTRPKPMCKIVGEFWAQMTEGDGNFRMFDFLESQGAEVIVEPLVSWLYYLLEIARFKIIESRGVHDPDAGPQGVGGAVGNRLKLLRLRVITGALAREHNRIRAAIGGTTRPLLPQREVRRLGERYYNRHIMGGEGYLEIGKALYYCTKGLSHMALGLKPFGCLPSTQSDAAMAAALADHPDMLYHPIETSGEGDVNAYSRVQMVLSEAKKRTRLEFEACVAKTGHDIEAIRAYCEQHRELRRPLQQIPRTEGVVGRAANFVLHVGHLMDRDKG